MTVNLAEQTLPDRLVNDIADLKRQLLDLKTKQLIGGDNTVVEIGATASAVATVTAGNTVFFTLTLVPTLPRVTLWDLAITPYVDGTGFVFNNIYPVGTNLTSAMKKIRPSWWYDYAYSDDISGTRIWRIRIENYDVTDHIIGLQVAAYAIKTGGTAS